MSKIQTALERAKGRKGTSAPVAPQKRSAETAAADAASATGQFLRQDPRNIAISQLPRVAIDREEFERNRLLVNGSQDRHPAQGAYRMLRTRLMQNMRSNQWRVLGVSSIGQNEGKTFTSINLAIAIAAEVGQEAVLVDLDLQRPSVYRYLGIDPGSFVPLREFFQDEKRELSELPICPSIDRLGCMLSADPLENSSDVLASPRGIRFFSELRERVFDKTVIIVDLPPLLAADDALAVAPMLDALLLVVAEGEAERTDVAEVRQILQEFNLIGTVLNKSNEKDGKRTNYY